MKLFPSVIFNPETSAGERRVRHLVEQLIGSEGSIAIHSLNLPDHEYKRCGEADFLLLDSRGLLVIEVKGGTVGCSEGEWRYSNGRGQARSRSEGPHQQAESAVQAVRNMLKKLGARYQPSVFGWAVAFPYTHWKADHAELPRELVIDADDCESAMTFTAAVDRVLRYWRTRSEVSGRTICPIDVADYASILVPAFQFAPAPARCAQAVSQDVIRLSQQQCEILEGLDDNPRLLVDAGAGTGKTVLAHAAAKKAAGEGKAVAFVVGAPLLAAHLARELPEVTVCATGEIQNLPQNAFDVLVVDEGQELANSAGVARLDRLLKGGIEKGSWRWFMDADNQALNGAVEEETRGRLKALATCWSPKRNVRSTREIVSVVQQALAADIGISEIDGRGIRPVVQVSGSDALALEWLSEHIADRLNGGVLPSDVVVLGAPAELQLIRRQLDWLPADEIMIVTGPQDLESSRTRLIVTDPAVFQGMERPWTMIACTTAFAELERNENFLYVGMTRSNSGLAIGLGPVGQTWLRGLYERSQSGGRRSA